MEHGQAFQEERKLIGLPLVLLNLVELVAQAEEGLAVFWLLVLGVAVHAVVYSAHLLGLVFCIILYQMVSLRLVLALAMEDFIGGLISLQPLGILALDRQYSLLLMGKSWLHLTTLGDAVIMGIELKLLILHEI
jgi:hypothetical protein